MSFLKVLLFIVVPLQSSICSAKLDPVELKCLVCEKTIDEIENIIRTVNPDRKVETGSYRLDAEGNMIKKSVPQRESEIYLSEVLDKVCDKMDDYVRATYKSDGRLTLLKIIGADGKMNPDVGNVDIIQDGDLNKSLKFYCEMLVEEYEEAMIREFTKNQSDIKETICTLETQYCDGTLLEQEEVRDDL